MLPSPALLRLIRGLALQGLLLAGLGACEKPRPLAVRVSIPGPDSVETPVTGVGLVALPYDRDSVLKALEQRARTPRPPTAPLDSLYAAFRGPFVAYSLATIRLGRLRDSLAATKTALDSIPRSAPGYSQQYAEFGRLTDSLRAAQDRVNRTRSGRTR